MNSTPPEGQRRCAASALVLLALLVVLVLGACGSDDNEAGVTRATAVPSADATDSATDEDRSETPDDPGHTASDNTASDDTASDDTASDETASAESGTDGTASEETGTEETVSEETGTDDGADPDNAGTGTEAGDNPGDAEPTPTPFVIPTATARPTNDPAEVPSFDIGPDAVEWSECAAGECGVLDVPLDWSEPDGPTIGLSLARTPARGEKQGSLLVNFGGPGGDGVATMSSYVPQLPILVQERFDIVTWDPRGTGGESRLSCPEGSGRTTATLYDDDDGFDDDAAMEVASAPPFEECTDIEGLLDNIGTVTTARDMDAVRAAVGDDQLTYLGYSYGTQLGWVYATLFPERVRALVLDAAVRPGDIGPEGWLVQLENFDEQLLRLDRLCDAADRCDIADEGLLETVTRIREELAESPLDRGDGTTFTEGDLLTALLRTLYLAPSEFGEFTTTGVAQLDEGDSTRLDVILSTEFNDAAYAAVICADGVGMTDEDDIAEFVANRFDRAEHFAAKPDAVWCGDWPARTVPVPPLDTSGAPTIMVVGTTEDPATPYEAAEDLTALLDDAVLVTHVGGGHGAVSVNPCIDAIFTAYVLMLQTPEPGVRCPGANGILGIGISGDGDDGPGAPIVVVNPDTPAAEAGIVEGDVLLQVDGAAIESFDDLPLLIPREPVEVVWSRDGEERTSEMRPLAPSWN